MRRSVLRPMLAIGICFALLGIAHGQAAKPARREALKPQDTATTLKVRWKAVENRTWRWFERETLVDEQWRLTGITTPVHRETGEYYAGAKGYLAQDLVPADVRKSGHDALVDAVLADIEDENEEPGKPSAARKAREGRPASKWLRSLNAKELSDWLKTVDPPEAGVEGMTFWEHLTRDHGFDPAKLEGLTEAEEAKLHAAAHEGY